MPGRPWRRDRPGEVDLRRDELLRAARLLTIRSRREATGLFVGRYASAFRGGGMVFDESRPYTIGDDVRRMDWNAMARTGQPFVKRYQAERNRTVWIVLDTSASMAFGGGRRSLVEVGAHAAALLLAVAVRAGDRVSLVTSGDEPARSDAPVRGLAAAWRMVSTLARAAGRPSGADGFESALARIAPRIAPDTLLFVISDFRPACPPDPGTASAAAGWRALAARAELVSVVVEDVRQRRLPDVGRIHVADAEHPDHSCVLDTRDPRVRRRFEQLEAERLRLLVRDLRRAGSEVVRLPNDRDPQRELARFFEGRAARRQGTPA